LKILPGKTGVRLLQVLSFSNFCPQLKHAKEVIAEGVCLKLICAGNP
jgi:hypothetical protein